MKNATIRINSEPSEPVKSTENYTSVKVKGSESYLIKS